MVWTWKSTVTWKPEKNDNMWRLNKLLKNYWVNKKLIEKEKKYLKINEKEKSKICGMQHEEH